MFVEKMFAAARECHATVRFEGEREEGKDRKHARCFYGFRRFVDQVIPADRATVHVLAIGGPKLLVP